MDKLLEKHTLLLEKLMNHQEIDNLNRPIISKKIYSLIKNLPTKEVQDKMISPVNSTEHLRIPILLKLFQKTKKKEVLPNSMRSASI